MGAGIPEPSTKSELLKTGRSKIQSSARIAYWERVNSGNRLYHLLEKREDRLSFREVVFSLRADRLEEIFPIRSGRFH